MHAPTAWAALSSSTFGRAFGRRVAAADAREPKTDSATESDDVGTTIGGCRSDDAVAAAASR